jgi:hypothetical protein
MENGTETTTEYQVEALENGAWRIFEVTTTRTVRAIETIGQPSIQPPVSEDVPALQGRVATAVAKVLIERPRMATDDVIYVLAAQGLNVSGRSVRRVRQVLRRGRAR